MGLTVAALEILAAKGFSALEIVQLARALEPVVDDQAERRRAKDRERSKERRLRIKSADKSADSSADSPQIPPPKDNSKPPVPFADANGASIDLAKVIFDEGVRLLTKQGRSEANARSFIASCQRDFGDGRTFEVLKRCRNATNIVSAMKAELGKAKAQAEYLGP